MKKLGVIIFALIFVAVGIFMFVRGNELSKRCTEETVGRVVSIIEEENYETDTETGNSYTTYTYYPVIEYEVDGNKVSKKYNTGSGDRKYSVNQKIDIMYNPNNVEEYIIKGDISSNIMGIIFTVLGLIVLGVGIFNKEL